MQGAFCLLNIILPPVAWAAVCGQPCRPWPALPSVACPAARGLPCCLWPALPPVACPALHYLSTLSHKQHNFRWKVTGHKCVFCFSLQLLWEIFQILRRSQRDIVASVQYSAVQYSTGTVQYSTVQCSKVYSTVQCSAVQYITVEYSTVQCSRV